jgi:hypothetical protein
MPIPSTILLVAALAAEPAADVLRDQWDVAYVGSDRIGFFHLQTTRRNSATGVPVICTRQHSKLTIRRFGQTMQMESISDFFEQTDGRLYATSSQSLISNEVTRSQGRLVGAGKFEVTVDSKGAQVKQTIEWPADVQGPYAQDESLRTKPLSPKEERTFRTFLPELNVVALRTLTASDIEPTDMPGEQRLVDLLRVVEKSDKVALTSNLWMNPKGEIVKMTLPVADLTMTTYRTTREEAIRDVGEGTVDLGLQTLVKPDKPVRNAHTVTSVTYRLDFSDAEAATAIPESRHQQIIERAGNSLLVKEQRTKPADDAPIGPSPGEEFLATNTYIQPNNAEIQRLARAATEDLEHPWPKAIRLEEWVSKNMKHQDFSIGFAPSSEIIETRQGDCTEHAVLLAAMCRALGIPSRVAMGLVYLEASTSFGYHMWTEVFVGGDWYAVDGTIGYGSIGGGHIKIADGSLQGVDANSTFLPIFKVIGKLKIRVESIDPT